MVPAMRPKPLDRICVGHGPPLVLLHGFAMQPRTYLPLARILADRVRVVIPAIFALPGRWTFGHALDCLEATLDDLGLERVSLLGHSFGGGLELGPAWWGFSSNRGSDIDRVVAAGIPCHVLWANHDTLLARSDGEEFARRLHATFTVASDGGVDHDWMFDDPHLFAEHLERLGLKALSHLTAG
jgi:pimeloyl-ACP methyl ester carboxylesterase